MMDTFGRRYGQKQEKGVKIQDTFWMDKLLTTPLLVVKLKKI